MQIIVFSSSLALMLLMSVYSFGQFIRLTINIPSGYEVNVNPVEPLVLEPPAESKGSGNTFGAAATQVRWIEMRARENVSFILSYRPGLQPMRAAGLFEMFLVNDGTTNYSEATRINSRKSVQYFFNKPMLMNQMPKGTPYFTAWLGVPANRGGVITIEYP